MAYRLKDYLYNDKLTKEQNILAIEKVGLYIPGGTAPLFNMLDGKEKGLDLPQLRKGPLCCYCKSGVGSA